MGGKAEEWWLRSPYTSYNSKSVRYVDTTGSLGYGTSTSLYGVRPAFIIDSSTEIYTDGTTYYSEQKYVVDLTDAKDNSVVSMLAEALGGAKVATGSYTGTGTFKKDYPCSLTFDFAPKIVIVFNSKLAPHTSSSDNGWLNSFIWITPQTQATVYNNLVQFTLSDTVLSWYSSVSVQSQCNSSGALYNYVAIG